VNYHTHRCRCGKVWAHGSECGGNRDAHTCPGCGELHDSDEMVELAIQEKIADSQSEIAIRVSVVH
jgi:hypothetical protein